MRSEECRVCDAIIKDAGCQMLVGDGLDRPAQQVVTTTFGQVKTCPYFALPNKYKNNKCLSDSYKSFLICYRPNFRYNFKLIFTPTKPSSQPEHNLQWLFLGPSLYLLQGNIRQLILYVR